MGTVGTDCERAPAVNAPLPDLAVGIADWLRTNQQADGRILDPAHREYGTYADGFAALVFGQMRLRTGDSEWESSCRRSLEVARRRPRESEFDQLALLLLAATDSKTDLFGLHAESVRLYGGHRLVSNNWVAMRALNYTLRGRLTGKKADLDESMRLWRRVLGWQTADGLFVDSPGGDATPVTYHAKFCAMLALALTPRPPLPSMGEGEEGGEGLRASLQRGLAALSELVSPAGVLVPFGRSRNTLFGYAAAIAALRLGAGLLDRPDYGALANRLETRIRAFQRADGHVPCVLNNGESGKTDWDVYVNNPDYNAYAAALLLLTEAARSDASPGKAQPAGIQIRQAGPILTIRDRDRLAAFSTRGQSVPFGTPFFCDHRYYGMQPLWIEQEGRVLFEPVPYCWRGTEDRTGLVDPMANPWIPFVESSEARYCVRRYDRVEVRQKGTTVEIEGEGQLEAYLPVPRRIRGLHALLSARGHTGPMFRAWTLDDARLRRRLEWNVLKGSLRATTQIEGRLPSGAVLRQAAQEIAEP